MFAVVMSLFACTPFSHKPLFFTNFGYKCTTSDKERERMTMNGTTSDNEWYNE